MRGCWVKLWMIGEQLCHVSIDQSDKDTKWTIMAAAALIKEYCKETGLSPAMAAEHIARMLEKKGEET